MSLRRRVASVVLGFLAVSALLGLPACGGGGGGEEDAGTAPVTDVTSPNGDAATRLDTEPAADLLASDDVPATADAGSDGESTGDALAPADSAGETEEDTWRHPDDPGPRPPHQREAHPAPTGPLFAGVGVGGVDGPVGVSMAGYGGRSDGINSAWSSLLKGSSGFYGVQTVKAIALEVDGERLVLMKIPTMSSEASMIEATTRHLRERYGLDLEGRILTGATHSHHTTARYWRLPSILGLVGIDEVDEEVIDLLGIAFAETVKRAIDDLAPAEWAYTYRDDWDPDGRVYRDRRHVNDATYGKDPRLTLFAVRRPDGTPMATILNFGVHGTAFGKENDLLTEDAPGAIEMKFEELFFARTGAPMVGLFIQSGGGDAAPGGPPWEAPTPQRIEMIGHTTAQTALELYETLEWQLEATLAVRSRRIDLRYSWMGYDEYPEFRTPGGSPYTWGGWECVGDGVPEGESMEGHGKKCTDLRGLLTLLGETVPHGEIHQLYLSTARLGPLFFVTIPAEPTYSVIKYLRDQIATRDDEDGGPLDVLAFGYSQDHLLYVLAPDDWFMGDYETEMSLWGPLGGTYLVDRQMELVDDLLEGYGRPAFYEESPSLSPPAAFVSRAYEDSLAAGDVTIDTGDETYGRTQVVRFAWNGGDASLGSPIVALQAEEAGGGFVDLPSPAGWPGHGYDNTRYHMITHYRPDPPPDGTIADQRRHEWLVDWEIPADFPAGTYRMVAVGTYWLGGSEQAYEVASTPFAVVQAADAQLAVTTDEAGWILRLTLPSVPFVRAPGESWPASGWRLQDPLRSPSQPIVVQAPLQLVIGVDEVLLPGIYLAHWDAAADAHRFDPVAAELTIPDGAAVTVHAHIDADRSPSPVEAPVP